MCYTYQTLGIIALVKKFYGWLLYVYHVNPEKVSDKLTYGAVITYGDYVGKATPIFMSKRRILFKGVHPDIVHDYSERMKFIQAFGVSRE